MQRVYAQACRADSGSVCLAVRSVQDYPVQYGPMFHARLFSLNQTAAAAVAVGVRAITTKTTTIKG